MVISIIISLTELVVTCGFGPVNVNCLVTGGEVETVVCNYDNGSIVEDCKQNNDDSSAVNVHLNASFRFA